ncbi:MAG: sialate O-acetylesterase [Paracoccaceae bacterium]
MSSIGISLGLAQSIVPDDLGPQAPPVLFVPSASADLQINGDAVQIDVSAPVNLAGSYVTAVSALATAPVNLVAPQLSGPAGEGQSISVDMGFWAYDTTRPAPALTLQWQRNGSDIPGAIAPDYVLTEADAGQTLVCTVTAAQPDHDTVTLVSDAVIAQGKTIVFSLLGQSNMVGWDTFDGGAEYPAGTLQVARSGHASGASSGELVAADHLLDHHNGSASFMGLALQFSIDYKAAHPHDTMVFVPDARGSTGFATGDWNPGDTYYEAAVARLNTLFGAHPEFVMGGFLWHQGESDTSSAADAVAYPAALDGMLAQIRLDVSAADATTPVVLGGMVPSWVTGDVNRQTVQDALGATPERLAYTGFAPSTGLAANSDGIHFNAASLRDLGTRYLSALDTARTNTAPQGSTWQIVGTAIQSAPPVPAPIIAGSVIN